MGVQRALTNVKVCRDNLACMTSVDEVQDFMLTFRGAVNTAGSDLAKIRNGAHNLHLFERSLDASPERFGFERLLDEVHSTGLHSLDGQVK